MGTKFVTDAGPFIHLAQINKIDLLQKLDHIIVPASVISEINTGKNAAIENIPNWKNIEIVEIREQRPSQINKIIKNCHLHIGESDVLHLSYKLHNVIILTDDFNARRACQELGIKVHGTVGVIANAFKKGWIPFKEAEKSLHMLQDTSSLFIASNIIESVIDELKNFT